MAASAFSELSVKLSCKSLKEILKMEKLKKQ